MSPATPAAGKAAVNASTHANAIAMGTGSSPGIDPSPASTTGASVISDGGPATPGDEHDEAVLIHGVAHLGLANEKHVNATTKLVASYSADKSEPKNETGYPPSTERYTPPFVRNGLEGRDSDPFKSLTPVKKERSSNGSPKPQDKRSLMNGDWRSGSSSSGKSLNFSQTSRTQLSYRRDEKPASTLDAQAIYPPAFCVFVANLLQTENEETLEAAVTQVFRRFGLVFVKIRRDGKNMPFAFCQYTNRLDAERAIREGKGLLILGRPCRCEKAKAHRLFFIERNYGDAITVEEAKELLTSFGKLTDCYAPSVAERTALNLNEGVMVQFELFECGRDAQAAFREHELYRIQAIAKNGASPSQAQQSGSEAARAYNARYAIDRRSIFVGNLPIGTTETQLHALFSHHGPIENILLVEHASKVQGGEKYVFAFVEYTSSENAHAATINKHQSNFMGKTLRVAPKNSEHGSRSRFTPHTGTFQSRSAPGAYYHSPAPSQPEQQASPLSYMSPPYGSPQYGPPAYGPPYNYPVSPYFGYTYTPDGQLAYYPAVYPPQYMGGSPGYHAPSPYYGVPGNEQYAASSPHGYYYQHPSMVSTNGPEDRSSTPTPAGHTSPMESH